MRLIQVGANKAVNTMLWTAKGRDFIADTIEQIHPDWYTG